MNEVDVYVLAATPANTRRSYASTLRHFEVEWGGFLPATTDSVARYLAQHAEQLSIVTLRHRLAALSHWHQDQGFSDPTKAPLVRKILKGGVALSCVETSQSALRTTARKLSALRNSVMAPISPTVFWWTARCMA